RALALLHLHRGGGASAAGRAVGLTPQAVRLIAKRYREGGLAASRMARLRSASGCSAAARQKATTER
ncbi:MAG: helix-turn-helix domain-containing protein, partial [Gemmatimonadetes bacterium]|nr:helix-turn-helix domain-containing protein [Gemmatimonadota bacterium]